MKSVNQEMQWFGVEACAGRVKYDDPRMYHFRSWEPKTPFAPRFDCPMWLDQVEPDKCKKNPRTMGRRKTSVGNV